jgi:hypothetical protein
MGENRPPCGRRDARTPAGVNLDSTPRPPAFDRRHFLKLSAGIAAYVSLRPHLGWARRASRAIPVLEPWHLPGEPPRDPVDLTRALIGAAVLAPSIWNTQPWRFEADVATIRLVADPRRSLPVLDPAQKGIMISLGAALENLLIAARSYGLHPTATYFPRGAASPVVAEVTWTPGDTRRDRSLFQAIPDRRTNRRGYDGRGIFPQNRALLLAQASDTVRLHWMDDRDSLHALAEVAKRAAEDRVLDRRAEAEQMSWMRFGDPAARHTGDGVTVDELEYGGLAHWFAGRYFNPHSWFLRFGAQAAGHRARDGFRSAGAAALLTSTQTSPSAWVMGGQTYERFALRATTLGISQQSVNEPIDLDRYRPQVLRAFNALGEEPLMLVRLGHAKDPGASVRRNVDLVSSFRNS